MKAADRGEPAVPGPESRPHELIRLATRLIVAQAIAAAAVGLPFSRRHVPSILITLALVAVLFLLAALVRNGGHGAWLIAISAESAFVMFGLSRFLVARYLGGTLLGIIALGTLLQPSVGRAFAAARRPSTAAEGDFAPAPEGLEDAHEGPLGGRIAG